MHAYSLQKCIWNRIYTYIYTYTHAHIYMYTCIHRYIYTYIHIHIHNIMDIYIYTYAYICTYTYIYVYVYAYLHIYISLHNSCMRACATVQHLPCHGSYCELILSLARTSCRLSFPPALLPLCRAGRPPASPLPDLFA